ncbi:MAG: TspO/MBR family protein, partial [Oscillospiraceae bacterium]
GDISAVYQTLEKPPLSPPDWIFSVVWIILYALMGISAYLVYRSDSEPVSVKSALRVYWLQLVVNFAWSIVFFRFQAFWAAFVVLIILLILVITMLVKFAKIRPVAALVSAPYLLWLLFAAYLNVTTALLN